MSSTNDNPTLVVLHVNPDDPEKSVSGRLYYVGAIGQYIHGFWESLRDDVLYACQFFDYRAGGQPIPEGTHKSAQVCFDRWLLEWPIEAEWLMDTCRHTLDAWATEVHNRGREALENRHPLPIWYGPNESNLATALEFNPVFDPPYPAPVKPYRPSLPYLKSLY